jgi:hypothetical protein
MLWKWSLYREEERRMDEKKMHNAASRPGFTGHDDKSRNKTFTAICEYDIN